MALWSSVRRELEPKRSWSQRKPGGVLAAEDGLVGFTVILEGPYGIPELRAGGGNHAAFTGGAEDFVLAKNSRHPPRSVAEPKRI